MIRPVIKTACLLVVLCMTVHLSPGHARLPERIELAAGESQVLKSDFSIGKIAVGDPDVLGSVKISDRELLINAKDAGQSNIFLWGINEEEGRKAEIRVIVRSRELDTVASEIREATKNIEDVNVRVMGNRVFVEGEVFTHNCMRRIETVVQGLPSVVNLVELSPVMKEIVKEEIEKSLRSQGMKNVEVTVAHSNIMLTGHVSAEEESGRAQRIAQAYSPDIVNAIAVRTPRPAAAKQAPKGPPPPPRPVLIEMSVNIMEIERNALRDFGVHWNPGGTLGAGGQYSGATGQSPTLSGSIAGTLSNLLPKTRRINETGQGRSLMQQTLITKSGDSAQFFAGSEVPIPVTQQGGTMSVEFKKIGVNLEFRPTIDPYDNIISSIRVDSSSITGDGAGGAPTISTTNLNTVLSVASGSSIALGGMMGQRDVAALSGSPPGGGTALVQANRAEREGADSREVVIFVTPRILTGEAADTAELQRQVEGDFKAQELERLRQQAR